MTSDYESLATEQPNPGTKHIDACGTLEMLRIMNQQDHLVPAAVEKELPHIQQAVDILYCALSAGGHMYYVGAGTSGRLGVLDASECPPTFSTPPEMVQGFIAGGDTALRLAAEGCEDDEAAGRQLLHDIGFTEKDVLVGITASGTAAYVLGAAAEAHALGGKAIAVTTNRPSKLEALCDVTIAPVVGPEVIMGSTRLKSGTAQKLVLNMLSTGVMIKLGKVYGNLMVDMKASNKKLYDRAVRIVKTATGAGEQQVIDALRQADMQAKLAIMMIQTGLPPEQAGCVLQEHGNRLEAAIRSVCPPVHG